LADRGFDRNDFLAAVADSGAQFLVRLRSARRMPVMARLDDGSFLTKIGGLTVRIIDADITVTCADGSVINGRYRLATSLHDPRLDSAGALIRLYHERWEIETAYYALRHTLLGGRVLRSGDPVGLQQELWALLTVYQLLRIAMVAAIESQPGLDPDRASFNVALHTARDQIILAAGVVAADPVDLVGLIGRTVLGSLLPARRRRISVRKVKSPTSRYHVRPDDDDRPLTSQNITALLIEIHVGQVDPPRAAADQASRPVYDPTARTGVDPVLAVLRADPGRAWTGPELAQELNVANVRSFCVQLSRWAKTGLIHRPARGIYALASEYSPRRNLQASSHLTTLDRLLLFLQADPHKAWPARELAEQLGATNIKSYQNELRRWADKGLIHKTTARTYALTAEHPPRPAKTAQLTEAPAT
jgi:hypothetical protein